jgi:hypothetical protein
MRRQQRLVLPGMAIACLAFVGDAAAHLALAEKPHSARLTTGPYLTGLSEEGVDIRFELDRSAGAAVEIARDEGNAAGAAALTLEDPNAATMHVIRARAMPPATRFAYVVRVGDSVVGQGRFTTAPKSDSGAPLKFLVYGDNRTDPTAHSAVVRALVATTSDFLVNTGDMVEDGGRAADWQSFFDIEATLLRDRALFVAIGNHELFDDRAGANFARYFGFAEPGGVAQPYGTVRLGSVRFFFMNAMHDWDEGEERHWLERELARADGEPGLVWRVAVMHQGPWSSGPHGGNAMLIRAHVPQLLEAHKIDLVFSGHDHIYERGDVGGVKYVVSGGGGAPLYRASRIASTRKQESTYHFIEVLISSEAIRLVAHRIDGSLLDQCGFGKNEGWDCDIAVSAPTSEATPITQVGGSGLRGWVARTLTSSFATAGLLLFTVALFAVRRVRARKR